MPAPAPSSVPSVHLLFSRFWGFDQHTEEFQNGLIDDHLPYGFEGLEDHGLRVTYQDFPRSARWERVAQIAYGRFGFDLVHPLLQLRALRRADVIFCPLEAEGMAAAFLRSVGVRGLPPVVTGTVWMGDNLASGGLRPGPRRAGLRALRSADRIVCWAASQPASLTRRFGVRPDRLAYVPFSINLRFWNPNRVMPDLPPPLPPRDVFSAGNDRDRDYRTLLEAFRGLPDEIRVHVAAGALPSDVARPANVVPLGHVGSPDKMRACYHHCAFVVIPTAANEHASGCTVACEAAAFGKAVIACDTGGMEDYVIPGETGLLVPPGDPSALGDAVRHLKSDPALCERLGRAAQSRAQERFGRASFNRRYAEIIHALLAGQG